MERKHRLSAGYLEPLYCHPIIKHMSVKEIFLLSARSADALMVLLITMPLPRLLFCTADLYGPDVDVHQQEQIRKSLRISMKATSGAKSIAGSATSALNRTRRGPSVQETGEEARS